jgi:hypothetical protein
MGHCCPIKCTSFSSKREIAHSGNLTLQRQTPYTVSPFKLPNRLHLHRKLCRSLEEFRSLLFGQLLWLARLRDSWRSGFHAGARLYPPPPPQSLLEHRYTGCHRRKGQYFGSVFFMLNYTEKIQNTYIQSWTVWEIMASEVLNFDSGYTLTDYQIRIETGRNMWFL